MPHENLIYAVNAHQLSNNEQEDIIILIYAASAEIAKNHITVYQQQNQIRLQYSFLPLPLNHFYTSCPRCSSHGRKWPVRCGRLKSVPPCTLPGSTVPPVLYGGYAERERRAHPVLCILIRMRPVCWCWLPWAC